MTIKTNIGKEIEIAESYMTVKDKKLYNSNTKSYEGIDGDRISFETSENGNKMVVTGTVDGYTHDGLIKIRGISEPFKIGEKFIVEHLAKIVEITDENATFAEISYVD